MVSTVIDKDTVAEEGQDNQDTADILVVDDEKGIRESIKEAIRQPLETAGMVVSFHEHVAGLARVGIVTANMNTA